MTTENIVCNLVIPDEIKAQNFVMDQTDLQTMCNTWIKHIKADRGVTSFVIHECDDNISEFMDSKINMQIEYLAAKFKDKGYVVEIQKQKLLKRRWKRQIIINIAPSYECVNIINKLEVNIDKLYV